MAERLLSVGLDVGTTTTQMILSRIGIENRASGFAVPEMVITERQVLYRSPIHFTPLLGEELVDGPAILEILEQEYRRAGITWEQVQSGAAIITGETSRKENAAAVLKSLSVHAGDFVVATAGPDLESALAAKGAGAVAFSEDTGKKVLHMDIGGGTANLALAVDGEIVATGCLNVGGRLVKYRENGEIYYISPVLVPFMDLKVGDRLSREQAEALARRLAGALEAAAGLREKDDFYRSLITPGTREIPETEGAALSFSGGVADCIHREILWTEFGDLGPCLGRAIRESRLCAGEYRLGTETIRATVIGAGCHSAKLSGSTVYAAHVELPLKNLPVLAVSEEALPGLRPEPGTVLSLKGEQSPPYSRVTALADAVAAAVGDGPCYVALEEDMGKSLGHALALRLPPGTPCLCLDGLKFPEGSYLDVGSPVGPAVPVVIKTLVLDQSFEEVL